MSQDTEQVEDPFEGNLKRVYAFLQDYTQMHRFPPSQREIASHCYISKGAVTRCLDVLQARGLIHRTPRQPRTIHLIAVETEQETKSE